METLISFIIASGVTFFFVKRYLKNLTANKRPAVQGASASPAVERRTQPCPRCGKPVQEGSAFCPSCGAALAMWNVHRAAVQTAAQGAEKSGRPRPVINASLCIGCGSCVDVCPETGTLEMMGGKAILAHPDRCMGHGDCKNACPTSAITLAFGNVLQTIRVPLVRENFETNLEGIFIVGELGGMGLIKTAINEGKLVTDHIRRRLEGGGLWAPPNHENGSIPASTPLFQKTSASHIYDVLIVGAGPAGLSASLTAHQYGLDYLTLEQGEVASTIRQYPRHKFLMAEPIEIPLYGNLYVGDGTKETLLTVWETIITNTGVRIQTNERVESIRRERDVFLTLTGKGQHRSRNVVLALGKRGTPRKLGAPGEDLSKVAYRLIEAESYSDNDILLVGGGDSAVEAALAVSKGGTNRVILSYRGDNFDRVRERNQKRLQEAESQGRLKVLRNSSVKEILPNSVVLQSKGEAQEFPNDYVFALIGGESPEDFLLRTGIEIVEKAISA